MYLVQFSLIKSTTTLTETEINSWFLQCVDVQQHVLFKCVLIVKGQWNSETYVAEIGLKIAQPLSRCIIVDQ